MPDVFASEGVHHPTSSTSFTVTDTVSVAGDSRFVTTFEPADLCSTSSQKRKKPIFSLLRKWKRGGLFFQVKSNYFQYIVGHCSQYVFDFCSQSKAGVTANNTTT